jgi:hypothetical protein
MFINLRKLFFFAIGMLFYNCKSTASIAEIENLKRVVNETNFEITANSATPIAFANTRGLENLLPPGSNVANINLSNIQNYIKIKKDSLIMNLPYYGELQIVSGYNSEVGLTFEGIPSDAINTFNTKKNNFLLMYEVKMKNENLKILITMYASKRCSFSINSSNRTTISYDGSWNEIE